MTVISSMYKILLFTNIILTTTIHLSSGTIVKLISQINPVTNKPYDDYKLNSKYVEEREDLPCIDIKQEHVDLIKNNTEFNNLKNRLVSRDMGRYKEIIKDKLNFKKLPSLNQSRINYWVENSVSEKLIVGALKYFEEYKNLTDLKYVEKSSTKILAMKTEIEKKRLFLLVMIKMFDELLNESMIKNHKIGHKSMINKRGTNNFDDFHRYLLESFFGREYGAEMKLDNKHQSFVNDLADMFHNYKTNQKLTAFLENENRKLNEISNDTLGEEVAKRKRRMVEREGWFRQVKDTDPLPGEAYYSYMLRCYVRGKFPLPQNLIEHYYGWTLSDDFAEYPTVQSTMILKILIDLKTTIP